MFHFLYQCFFILTLKCESCIGLLLEKGKRMLVSTRCCLLLETRQTHVSETSFAPTCSVFEQDKHTTINHTHAHIHAHWLRHLPIRSHSPFLMKSLRSPPSSDCSWRSSCKTAAGLVCSWVFVLTREVWYIIPRIGCFWLVTLWCKQWLSYMILRSGHCFYKIIRKESWKSNQIKVDM